MRTDKLARNDLSEAAFDWYRRYLRALDDKDLDAYAAFLADDCELVMNNEAAIVGKPAIVAMLGPYWQSFGSIEHDLLAIYGSDGGFVLEAWNHYRRLDGSRVSVRAVALTDRDGGGQARSVRICSDTSPVFREEGAA